MTAATGSTPASLLASPTGQPVAQLFANTLGRAPAVFFTLAGFAVMNLCSIPGIQGGSRTIFAYARDDLLPWSSVWRKLDACSGTPVAAVWLFVVLSVAVNVLGLIGEEAAVAAVFNICTVALNLSYLLPIVCKMAYGRFERGPWHLGRWSWAMNAVAVGWNVFVSVIFFLPTKLPVTNKNVSLHFGFRISPLEVIGSRLGIADNAIADELRQRRVRVCHSLLSWLLVFSRTALLHWRRVSIEEEFARLWMTSIPSS